MATLTGNTVASTYKQLLKVTSEGIGADASAKYIEDGLGTDSALSISTTRVGIGTDSPKEIVEIQKTFTADNGIHLSLNNPSMAAWGSGIEFTDGTSPTLTAHIGTVYSARDWTKARLAFKVNDDASGSPIEYMSILGTGNVGIGTAAPSSRLEIVDNDGSGTTILRVRQDDGNVDGIELSNDVYSETTNHGLRFIVNDDGASRISAPDKGSSPATLSLQTDNTSRIVISATGNVGIGTASPAVKLNISDATTNAILRLTNRDTSIVEDDVLGAIEFEGNDENADANGVRAKITVSGDDSNNQGAVKMRFQTKTNNTQTFTTGMTLNHNGYVGIGTTAPGNPLAINRSGDGVIVDFESADAVEGTVSISGTTTSYNAFVGSHYTQLKDGQNDLPVGAVVSSTGEIITCNLVTEAIAGVDSVEAKDAVYETVTKQRQKVVVTEIEEEQTGTEIVEEGGKYVQKSTTETVTKEVSTPQYEEVKLYGEDGKEIGTHQIQVMEDYEEEQLVSEAVEAVEAIEAIEAATTNSPNKEYFTYINTTTTASDPTVYGTWMGKMSDDAKGHSFGDDDKPIYLVAQVGLFKIRVTDTNGNIAKGDYLESSTRAMEGQKQTSNARVNSTIGKAMIDVDWSSIDTDSDLSYKWKLIPCTF